jgi:hypothetical protein
MRSVLILRVGLRAYVRTYVLSWVNVGGFGSIASAAVVLLRTLGAETRVVSLIRTLPW